MEKEDCLLYVTECYDRASSRSNELSTDPNFQKNPKIQVKLAKKIYAALASYLYTSISIAKAQKLEHFIERAGAKLPRNVFDFEEWKVAIDAAKQIRYQDRIVPYSQPLISEIPESSDMKSPETVNRTVNQHSETVNKALHQHENLKRPAVHLKNDADHKRNNDMKLIQRNHELTIRILESRVTELEEFIKLTNEQHNKELLLEKENAILEAKKLIKLPDTKEFDLKLQETILMYEKQLIEKNKIIEDTNMHHELELTAISIEHKNQLIELESKRINDLQLTQANNNLTIRTLESRITDLEDSIKNLKDQHSRELLTEREKTQSEFDQRMEMKKSFQESMERQEISHKDIRSGLQREIQRLEKTIEDTLATGKTLIDAEAGKFKGQLSVVESAYKTRLLKSEDAHNIAMENLRREVKRQEKLVQDVIEAGKKNVENEVRRGVELVNAEIKIRNDMEADYKQQLEIQQEKHLKQIAEINENFQKEKDMLMRTYEDAVEYGKRQVEAEALRGKERLDAAEASYIAKLALVEDNFATMCNTYRQDILRLEKRRGTGTRSSSISIGMHNIATFASMVSTATNTRASLLEGVHTATSPVHAATSPVHTAISPSVLLDLTLQSAEQEQLEEEEAREREKNKANVSASALRMQEKLMASETKVRRLQEQLKQMKKYENENIRELYENLLKESNDLKHLLATERKTHKKEKDELERQIVTLNESLDHITSSYEILKSSVSETQHTECTLEVYRKEIERLTRMYHEALDSKQLELQENTKVWENKCNSIDQYNKDLLVSITDERERYHSEVNKLELLLQKQKDDLNEDHEIEINRLKRQLISLEAVYTVKLKTLNKEENESQTKYQNIILELKKTIEDGLELHKLQLIQQEQHYYDLHHKEMLFTKEKMDMLTNEFKETLFMTEESYQSMLLRKESIYINQLLTLKNNIQNLEKQIHDLTDTHKLQLTAEANRWQELLTMERNFRQSMVRLLYLFILCDEVVLN